MFGIFKRKCIHAKTCQHKEMTTRWNLVQISGNKGTFGMWLNNDDSLDDNNYRDLFEHLLKYMRKEIEKDAKN